MSPWKISGDMRNWGATATRCNAKAFGTLMTCTYSSKIYAPITPFAVVMFMLASGLNVEFGSILRMSKVLRVGNDAPLSRMGPFTDVTG